jgi:hypothetical protein
MDLGFDKAKIARYKASFQKAFGHPAKLRLAVTAAIGALVVVAAFVPLSDQIQQARADLAAQRRRLDAVKDVEALRHDIGEYRGRIGDTSDTNEWVQYLLGGSRQAQVHLRNMESKEPQKVGPYKAVCLVVELEGSFPRLRQFVEWLEQSPRLLRVEEVRFERQPVNVMMKLRVLGLVGKSA